MLTYRTSEKVTERNCI